MRSKKINFKIRAINKKDKEWIKKFILREWASEKVISWSKIYYPYKIPGFVALANKKYLGLITYRIEKKNCEIVTLNSIKKRVGIGTALIEKVKKVALKSNCKKLKVATTNDNINALRFYQKRGFYLVDIRPNVVAFYRKKINPEIPLIGNYKIPIRDELRLEMKLKN